jgi:hypothetical protein
MVWLLVRMNHQYEREDAELGGALVRLDATEIRRPIVVLLVEAFDAKMIHALGYAKTIRAERTIAVHIEEDPLATLELETAYTNNLGHKTRVVSDFPLQTTETADWDAREGTPRRYVRARQTLGKGGGVIRVRTVNGNVVLNRAL